MALDSAELQRLRRLIADIPGWLTDEEGEALYELARSCTGKGVIVEIGSWKGKSTTCLGLGSRAGQNVPIFAVDPHADYRFGEFKENIERAGIADLVTAIPSLSQAAAPEFDQPIELLFVDGSHEYEDVKADFDQWVPKLVEGGTIAVHDTTLWEGPKRVVEERIYRGTGFKDVRFVFGSTTVGTKVGHNTAADRLRARYSLGLKRGFELTYRARKLVPAPLTRAGRRVLRAIR
jgi:predicted O-methyltransferase YrrM